jgi:hypothetical protein
MQNVTALRTKAPLAETNMLITWVPHQVSLRVLATDPPVIVKTKQLMSQAPPGKDVSTAAAALLAAVHVI